MSQSDEKYKQAMAEKEIPLLPLDNKWHQLFTQTEPNAVILYLEEQLNQLIRRQGKLNTETKEIHQLKKKLMDQILVTVDELDQGVNSKLNNKKIDADKRLVQECNEKLNSYKKELEELPKRMEELNRKLMLATMEICYSRIKENTEDIEAITKWIHTVRVELKKNVIRKQEKEAANKNLYSYMHDIFGAEVLELFDMKYNPMEEKEQIDLTSPLGGIKEET